MLRPLLLPALLMMPGAALACSPAIFEPSPTPRQGPDCAVSIDLDEVDIASLGAAVSLGGRIFLQPMSDGNGCYNRQNLLVHDCNSGQVMVIGTERFALMEAMEDPRPTGLELIRDEAVAASAEGRVPGFAEFTAMSQAQGYGSPLVMRTDQSLQFGDRRLPVSCVCRTMGRGGG